MSSRRTVVFLALLALSALGDRRRKRLFSVFNVIRFSNDACPSNQAGLTGVCYTSAECVDRGGQSAGDCAGGFGVCCVFQVGCDSRTSENCTYFSSGDAATAAGAAPVVLPGVCSSTVCRCDSNVCQLRLDFLSFSLPGPVADGSIVGKTINGDLAVDATAGGVGVTANSACRDAAFFVASPGVSGGPPVICGQNSGEHVYVEASSACNTLTVTQTPAVAPGASEWLIKVTQLRCDFVNLAPPGCTQWLFGSLSGVVQTFNFESGSHLADQDQSVCVRRERGTCSVCWTPAVPADFQLSGPGAMGITDDRICCAYGLKGLDVRGFDCALIPGARTAGAAGAGLKAVAFCGSGKGLATLGTQTALTSLPLMDQGGLGKTVCSDRTPFQIRFVSDSFEFVQEAAQNQRGFRLVYNLVPCPNAAADQI